MSKCLISGGQIETIMSFGKMPVANGFLSEKEFSDEYFYELKIGFCPVTKMVQLIELVDRERMFHEKYAFYSSTSAFMKKHFSEFAEFVSEKYLYDKKDLFVAEIGSNDGIMLQNFAEKKIKHLGIEPSKMLQRLLLKKV